MYRIAILEDETEFMDRLKQSCRSIMNSLKAQYAIYAYSSSEALLEAALVENREFDFLLLDILMEGDNGLEAARKIREHKPAVPLAFITQSRDFAIESYQVKAAHYLVKPDYEKPLEALLQEDYRGRYQQQYFVFENGTDKSRVLLCDVTHMEITGRKVLVHLPGQSVVQAGKLSDLLDRLPAGAFARCHQGYAVNMQHVDVLRHREVRLDNGLGLPVSRTFYAGMRQAYVNYYLGTEDTRLLEMANRREETLI